MVAQFEIYKSAGEWRWRFKSSGNYKNIARSSEGYDSKEDCERSVEIIKEQAKDADVEYTDK